MFVPVWALVVGGVAVLGLLAWALTRGGSERRADLVDPTRAIAERARAKGFDEGAAERILARGGDDRYEMPGKVRAAPAAVATDLPDEVRAEVWQQLHAGHKINAIKLVRERTGLGLREAKDLVEAIERSGATPG